MSTLYDVIVVGAGPGGSSAATFLAREGAKVLVLDKSAFPRDKVCGDGLTPQAIYLARPPGLRDEVLAHTKGCIKSADIVINGEKVLTGGYPPDTIYPDFAILLDRRRLDNILLEHAADCGADFEDEALVRDVEVGSGPRHRDGRAPGQDGRIPRPHRHRRRRRQLSRVARHRQHPQGRGDGRVAQGLLPRLPLRWRPDAGLLRPGSYFPGYGWLFVDDDGFANIGLGCLKERRFPLRHNLGASFRRFIAEDLADMLADATQCGPFSGGSSGFFRPRSISAARVMLIGDAANQADPLNGGGIHKAMESAWCAAEALPRGAGRG